MDYFCIKEDKTYIHTPVITNLNDIVNRRAAMSLENAINIPDINLNGRLIILMYWMVNCFWLMMM